MNLLKNKLLILGMFTPLLSFAQGSGNTGGGSNCELAIENIRADLLQWVQSNHEKKINFSSTNLTEKEYSEKMIKALAKVDVEVRCENTKKSKTPIIVGGVPKTCMNWYESKEKKYYITCDYKKFYKDSNPLDQYKLIHHEFASLKNIGVEFNHGSDSDYEISKQIKRSLKKTIVYRLEAGDHSILRAMLENKSIAANSVIKKIFGVWKSDLNNLELLSKTNSLDEIIEMKKIKDRLSIPGKEVKTIYLQSSEKYPEYMGGLMVMEFINVKVSDADTDELLFTSKVRVDDAGLFSSNYIAVIDTFKIQAPGKWVRGNQHYKKEVEMIEATQTPRRIGRSLIRI